MRRRARHPPRKDRSEAHDHRSGKKIVVLFVAAIRHVVEGSKAGAVIAVFHLQCGRLGQQVIPAEREGVAVGALVGVDDGPVTRAVVDVAGAEAVDAVEARAGATGSRVHIAARQPAAIAAVVEIVSAGETEEARGEVIGQHARGAPPLGFAAVIRCPGLLSIAELAVVAPVALGQVAVDLEHLRGRGASGKQRRGAVRRHVGVRQLAHHAPEADIGVVITGRGVVGTEHQCRGTPAGAAVVITRRVHIGDHALPLPVAHGLVEPDAGVGGQLGEVEQQVMGDGFGLVVPGVFIAFPVGDLAGDELGLVVQRNRHRSFMNDGVAIHVDAGAPIGSQGEVPAHAARGFLLELEINAAEIRVVVVVERVRTRIAIGPIQEYERTGLLILVVDIGRGDHAADLQSLEAGRLGLLLDARDLHIRMVGHLRGFICRLLVVGDLGLLRLDLRFELLHLGFERLQLVQDVGVGVGMCQWGEPQAGRQHGEFELVHQCVLQVFLDVDRVLLLLKKPLLWRRLIAPRRS